MLTQERLKELLHYDPKTGVFTWVDKPSRNMKSGVAAGGFAINGYWRIAINRRRYYAHRLAWFWMTGKWPKEQVDHINHDRADNRWTNLRVATNFENSGNTRIQTNNTSGWKGVGWDKPRKKWHAYIKIDGKTKHLGRFDCPAAAHFSYVVAADKAFGEFACPH